METLRVVNKALVGEEEHPCLQNINSLALFEFSQIDGENISDKDISHPTIQQILNNTHLVQAEILENNKIRLHF